MRKFWGDDSWQDIVWENAMNLFGETEHIRISSNLKIVNKFRERLKTVAGFEYVPAGSMT